MSLSFSATAARRA